VLGDLEIPLANTRGAFTGEFDFTQNLSSNHTFGFASLCDISWIILM
jgi:hypothetical protein